MPNWCNNSLTLVHLDLSYLKQVGETLCSVLNPENDEDFEYNDLDLLNDEEKVTKFFDVFHSNDNTKVLDVEEVRPMLSQINVNKTTFEICIVFDTAWSPPIAFYEFLVKDNWVLNALYHEPGMEFCGSFTNEKGDVCYEYDSSDKSSFEVIPEDILDFTCLLDEDDSDDEESDDEIST
jgi:hypothetical protein